VLDFWRLFEPAAPPPAVATPAPTPPQDAGTPPRPLLPPRGGSGTAPPKFGPGLPGRPSKIRLWRLGSLEHKVTPTAEAIEALARMVQDYRPGQDLDIVWGPDLEIVQLDADTNDVQIVAGPNVRLSRTGNVVRVEATPPPDWLKQ
jgi:hypothetical protein